MRNLTQVEGMSLDVLRQAVSTGALRPFPNTWSLLRRKGSAVNLAAYIGHSSLRTWVMGARRALGAPQPTPRWARWPQLVREAMAAGAVGFASSTSPAHNGEGGLAHAVAPGQRW